MVSYRIPEIVSSSSEEDKIFIAMSSLCDAIGCRYWFISLAFVTGSEIRYHEMSNIPKGSVSHSASSVLGLTTPTLQRISSSRDLVQWQSDESELPAIVRTETLATRALTGIADGVSVGLEHDQSHMLVLSLASLKKIDVRCRDIILACAPFICTSLRKIYNDQMISHLTERERQVLQWAAFGKTSWEISQILQVSERTINFHIARSIEKLGARNRAHAVARAVHIHAINPDHGVSS